MLISRLFIVFAGALSLVCIGCGSDNFNVTILEAAPIKIDAEYVTLTPVQLQCGTQEELWEAPVQSGDRSTARLMPKGRDLKLADDVSIGDLRLPYVQIRGEFPLKNIELVNIKDGPEKETKLLEMKVGVVIPHTCFSAPLPMMGVRRGKFTQDAAPIFFFRYNNGWQMEKLVH